MDHSREHPNPIGDAQLVVSVFGDAATQGSKSIGRNGRLYEANAGLKKWRTLVEDSTALALAERPDWNTSSEAVSVSIVFAIKRPQSHFRTGRFAGQLRPRAPMYCNRYPDIDKAERAILDSLQRAGAIADDARVVSLGSTKMYAGVGVGPPGARIMVRPVSVGQVQEQVL